MTTQSATQGIQAATALLNAIQANLTKQPPSPAILRILEGIVETQHGLIDAQNRMEYLQRENDRLTALLAGGEQVSVTAETAAGGLVIAMLQQAIDDGGTIESSSKGDA